MLILKTELNTELNVVEDPNVLKFFIDGVDSQDNEQQGDMRETQKEIEKVIGFPILCLSI